jgi:hypothetical protein
VDPKAPAGGDGSIGAPFNGVEEATAVAPDGSVLVLSTGAHPHGVLYLEGLQVVGACARGTTLVGVGQDAAVQLRSASLSNVRVEDGLVLVHADSSATISDVVIADCPGFGLFMGDSSTVAASNVLLRGVGDAVSLGAGSRLFAVDLIVETAAGGIFVGDGATLDLRRGVIVDAAGGLELGIGAGAVLEDVVAAETDRFAIIGGERAEISGTRVAVLDPAGGCLATGLGTVVRLSDLTLSGCAGDALFLYLPGADVEVTRARIERSTGFALNAPEPGVVVLNDLSLRGSMGLRFDQGGRLDLVRAELDMPGHGIRTIAANVWLEDVAVRGGALELDGGRIDGLRVASSSAAPFALHVKSGTAVLNDVHISDAEARGAFDSSTIIDNATVEVNRMLLERNGSGLYAGTVQGTISDLAVRSRGRALAVFAGGLQLVRVQIDGSDAGILVSELATASFQDLSVTRVRGGAGSSCIDSIGATSISEFLLGQSSGYGARILERGSLRLSSGEISDNLFGCGHPPGYDLELLTKGVSFRGNGTDLSEL